jgi:hydrogenase/urease accessory protein HupE
MPRSLASTLALAALSLMSVAGFASPAHAHGGDHAHMSVAELVAHLSASLDHKSAMVAIGVAFALATVLALLTGKKRAR